MTKTNIGLVEYAKSKLNLPTIYMLGGFGRKLTQAMIDRRVKELKCSHTINNLARIRTGIGKYCFDCVGLIKGYLWEESVGIVKYNIPAGSDQNVGMMYRSAKEKGNISTMPDIVGLLVYTVDLGHVGVYIGKNANGQREYIESTPAFNAWGVTKTNDAIRKWAYWGKYHLVDYVQPARPVQTNVVYGAYTVVRGDSLSLIASRYNITWQELHQINPEILKPNEIEVGQIIRVPLKVETTIVEKIVEKEVIKEVQKPVNAIFNNGVVEVTVKTL